VGECLFWYWPTRVSRTNSRKTAVCVMIVYITRKHALIFHQHSPSSSDDTTVYLLSYGQCHATLFSFCKMINLPHIGGEDPKNGAYDPEIQTQDFYTMHPPTKFHHPMFNRSKIIVLTNKQANKHPQLNKERDFVKHIHYATLVGEQCNTSHNCVHYRHTAFT